MRDPALGLDTFADGAPAVLHFDGVSIYELSDTGLVRAHKIDNMVSNHSKAFALTCSRALTWYFLRLSSPRMHVEPWKAVGTRGRGSLAAR